LGHEHAPVHLKADGFAQLDPAAGAVGAIAIDGLAADGGIGQGGRCRQGQGEYPAHGEIISQQAGLTKCG